MKKLNQASRDGFGSSLGMLLALVGSAVGLGNIWRFPYMVGENGGAAFILIYLFFALVFSLPLILCEFVIGRRGQANAAACFTRLAPGSKWGLAGLLTVLSSFVILSFYSVIGGWGVEYFFKSVRLDFTAKAGTDYAAMFSDFVSGVWPPIIFALLFFVATAAVVSTGVKNGIEKCSKIMMPVLFFLMLFLAVRSMLLPGAGAGIDYVFKPDFSLVTADTVVAAMGQAFFSLSIGIGILTTFASYSPKSDNMVRSSALTVIFDTLFALIASCAIMPAVFAFGFSPSQGPGLVFIMLPKMFGEMPGGGIVAIVFFFAFFIAAATSAISLLEVVVAYVSEKFSISRRKAVFSVSAVLVPIMVAVSLSQGALSGITVGGKNLLDLFDYVTSTFMITAGGFLIVIFTGWKLGKAAFVDEMSNGGTIKLPRRLIDTIFFLIKYIIPVGILAIVVSSL